MAKLRRQVRQFSGRHFAGLFDYLRRVANRYIFRPGQFGFALWCQISVQYSIEQKLFPVTNVNESYKSDSYLKM